jgi:hypothetical protein
MTSTALLVMDVQQGIVDRFGGDEEYLPRLAADGCLDADPEVHRVLTEKVLPRQAGVVSIAEWTKSLARPAAG